MKTADFALPINKGHIHFSRALNPGVNPREAKAAFIPARDITAVGCNFGIEHNQGHLDIRIKPRPALLFHIHFNRDFHNTN